MAKTKDEAPALPSAFSLFTPSIEALKVNLGTLLALAVGPTAYIMTVLLISGGLTLDTTNANTEMSGFTIVMLLLGVVLSVIVAPAIPYVELQSVKGKKVSLEEALKKGLSYFWRFVGLSLLVGLLVVAGFILLIIPGLFMLRRYFLAAYYLYDQNLSISDAMKRSAEESKQFSGAVWGVLGVTILLQLPSVIPVFGGIASLVLSIFYYCAPAVRYQQIQEAIKA